eukprot:scaffold31179_cov131-Skeletonema_menzelii.AAC.3
MKNETMTTNNVKSESTIEREWKKTKSGRNIDLERGIKWSMLPACPSEWPLKRACRSVLPRRTMKDHKM